MDPEKRAQLLALAKAVVDGSLDPVEGCFQLSDLSRELGEEGLPVYFLLSELESRIDDLPRGADLELESDIEKAYAAQKKAGYREAFGAPIKEACREVIKLIAAP
jgi:hypothetical protein